MMIHVYQDAPETVFLTLAELATLPDPFYLFVFERRVASSDNVAVVLQPEVSNDRADQFTIDGPELFGDKSPGQWTYKVYEQDNADNLDPASSGTMIETGTMDLHEINPFRFKQPTNKTSFTQP